MEPNTPNQLLASWKWDEKSSQYLEVISGEQGFLEGNFKIVDGVHGKALKCDEFTTRIHFQKSPPLTESFSIEVWCALASYPWAWAPFIDLHVRPPSEIFPSGAFRDPEIPSKGILFGVNQNGQVGLLCGCECEEDSLDLKEGNWIEATSPYVVLADEDKGGRLPLKEWVHLVCVYDKNALSAKVYMNGKCVGEKHLTGPIIPPEGFPVYIARQREMVLPMGGERPSSHSPIYIHLDGIIDGLRWCSGVLDEPQIQALYTLDKPSSDPAFEPRILPFGPKGPGKFGAYYTKLKYYEEWDNLWRVDAHPDVVVRFDDELASRLIFWRGTSYIPCWAAPKSGSGDAKSDPEYIWFTHEFNETWGSDVDGCAEPMSDKMCRHSQVRIIESNETRVIIHWRYALVDVHYKFARLNYNNWGDWSDEYLVVYPDGIGVRKIALKTEDPYWPHEFQESILIEGPGQKPEDLVDAKAVTMLNMKGESHTYDWTNGCPKTMDKPEKCNIQLINIKSKVRPFLIVPDGPSKARAHTERPVADLSKPFFVPFSGGIDRENAIFPFWNHWPTAQIISDGRVAPAADRAAHSSFSNLREWQDYEITKKSRTKLMLVGLHKGGDEEIIPLAKSWLNSPEIKVLTENIESNGYDPTDRAYHLIVPQGVSISSLKLEVLASKDQPVQNIALVIENWGENLCHLKFNGRDVEHGKDFRYGHRDRLEGIDLIIFLQTQSEDRVAIELEGILKIP
jgi:hypothetical protein